MSRAMCLLIVISMALINIPFMVNGSIINAIAFGVNVGLALSVIMDMVMDLS